VGAGNLLSIEYRSSVLPRLYSGGFVFLHGILAQKRSKVKYVGFMHTAPLPFVPAVGCGRRMSGAALLNSRVTQAHVVR